MKNKFLLLLFSLLLNQFLMAQNESKVAAALKEFNNDTASYIKQHILARKNSYIGQPLDSLLKDLPMITEYLNGVAHNNRYICPNTTLCFSSYQQRTDKMARKEFAQVMTITWATPLDNKELSGLGRVSGGKWTQAAYNYYKNKIIGDVGTVKY